MSGPPAGRSGDRIRVGVAGARGRMGRMTCAAVARDPELELVAAVDPAFAIEPPAGEEARVAGEERFTGVQEAIQSAAPQVMVDFTIPSAVLENVLTCVRGRVPVVVGTTGLSAADLARIDQEAARHGVPVFVAPNFAMGAVLMMQFARQAAAHFKACEIVELHHDGKLDAPSGTSRLTRMLVEEAWREAGHEKELPIHSVRLPGLVAHQEVIFGGLGETLTIRHDSLSRESFMPGVLLAVKRVRGLQGLVVGLENIL
ncbi:MAG: 4-hydroxy-tetrahydrodipicolinate reductase [Actinomycetia bacterium]|nr:4-hydroxy-tetrahydrodipicolinate reductase [Actinomycetes bacterium]